MCRLCEMKIGAGGTLALFAIAPALLLIPTPFAGGPLSWRLEVQVFVLVIQLGTLLVALFSASCPECARLRLKGLFARDGLCKTCKVVREMDGRAERDRLEWLTT